ncbi:hypothetical protein PR048_001459 [Dryococelus australis]|uniref:Uncharacterized protein n=1 Tax=Dryococelus australis TaxID=614101 RepID=A0ABQ9IHE9_9NEOP|nr:hypothetical protein PR048_001459 [Dryococelus australis]
MKGRGKWEIPEKTCRPTASSGTIPTCEDPATRPGIEPGSPWWEASVLTIQPPWPLISCLHASVSITPLLNHQATWRSGTDLRSVFVCVQARDERGSRFEPSAFSWWPMCRHSAHDAAVPSAFVICNLLRIQYVPKNYVIAIIEHGNECVTERVKELPRYSSGAISENRGIPKTGYLDRESIPCPQYETSMLLLRYLSSPKAAGKNRSRDFPNAIWTRCLKNRNFGLKKFTYMAIDGTSYMARSGQDVHNNQDFNLANAYVATERGGAMVNTSLSCYIPLESSDVCRNTGCDGGGKEVNSDATCLACSLTFRPTYPASAYLIDVTAREKGACRKGLGKSKSALFLNLGPSAVLRRVTRPHIYAARPALFPPLKKELIWGSSRGGVWRRVISEIHQGLV